MRGGGPTVVLVHGFGLDMRMWDPQVDNLAAHRCVVRYDCRGFEASGQFDPAIPYTHSADLLALLDHLITIVAPTLVVVGDRDVACFQGMAEILSNRIPAARYQQIPHSGRMVNMEQASEITRLIADFADTHVR